MRRRAIALVLAASIALPAVVPLELVKRPLSTVVLDRDGVWLAAFVASDGRWRLSPGALPEQLKMGLLAFEDRRFAFHPGVDPVALIRATLQNLASGEVVSGGSTITMQVARMMDPRPRTLPAKAIEAFRALQLELRYSKEEILALYFELAPYGGNIEGIEAAARLYYQKPALDLSLDEIATLIALPNAPERLRPDRHPERLRVRRNDVLVRMHEAGLIAKHELDRALALPIHAERRPPPRLAPHLAERHRGRGIVRTTLDADLQRLASEHLSHRIAQLGFGAGAVVIIENDTRAVLASVGSAVRALRSPGSTLKPFAYALGFDRGLIGMRTLLHDVPTDHGGWSPQNFDGAHRGLVSVEDALTQSLNVPAVEMVRAMGADSLIAMLARAGFTAFRGPREHGLAVVLGGCEVSLLELTNLYASLASGGRHLPVRFEAGQAQGTALFSEEAAFLITEILRSTPRPRSERTFAYKTDTSYGRRDAWSIGYDPRFTVGVWIGNLDGRGNSELVGIDAAAPLLFAIAGALPGGAWFESPPGISKKHVCSLSGLTPTAACPHTVEVLAAERGPAERCAMHARIAVDDETGQRRCERCRIGRRTHAEVRVQMPPRVQAWLTGRGEARALPPHDPSCVSIAAGAPPSIAEPADGDVFRLVRGVPSRSQRIALEASASSDELWWFVDGVMVERAPPGRTVLIDPIPGQHHISAVDAEGRSARVRIDVLP